MATPMLTVNSTLLCPHGGSVSAVSTNSRVRFDGAPVVVQTDTFLVSGCPFQIPIGTGTKPSPCIKLQFVTAATRVRVGGTPALLNTDTALSLSAEQAPQGPPTVALVQFRVKGV